MRIGFYFQTKHHFSQAAKSYKSMFYCFLRVYEGDKSFTCLNINKKGLRTHTLSVFISLKGACLIHVALGNANGSHQWAGYFI